MALETAGQRRPASPSAGAVVTPGSDAAASDSQRGSGDLVFTLPGSKGTVAVDPNASTQSKRKRPTKGARTRVGTIDGSSGSVHSAGGSGNMVFELPEGKGAPVTVAWGASAPSPEHRVGGADPSGLRSRERDERSDEGRVTGASEGRQLFANHGKDAGTAKGVPPAGRRRRRATTGRRRTLAFKRSVYSFIAGDLDMVDPPAVFLWNVMRHHAWFLLYAIGLALVMMPWVFVHAYLFDIYNERWEAVGGNTTEVHGTLGLPVVFDTGESFFWIFSSIYAVSALTTVVSVMYVWVGVITRWHRTKTLKYGLLLWFVLYPCYVFGTYALSFHMDLQISQNTFIYPAFLAGVITLYYFGKSFRSYLMFPRFGRYLALQTFVQAAVFSVYVGQLPKLFLATDSQWIRVLLRLIVHPILFEIAHATNRVMVMLYPRHLSEKRLCVYVLPAFIMSNLLGRFLVSSMPDLASTVALSAALGALEIALRMTTPMRDYAYTRVLFGADFADDNAFSAPIRHVKADIMNIDIICEFYGILVAPFIVWGFNLRLDGEVSALGAQLTSTAVQLGIEIVVDLLPALLVVCASRKAMSAMSHSKRIVERDSSDDEAPAPVRLTGHATYTGDAESADGPPGTAVMPRIAEGASTEASRASRTTTSTAVGDRSSQASSGAHNESGQGAAAAAKGASSDGAAAQAAPDGAAAQAAPTSSSHVQEIGGSSLVTVPVSEAGDIGTSQLGLDSPLAGDESGDEDYDEQQDSMCQEVMSIKIMASLKSTVVTSMNVWDHKFKHFFFATAFFVIGWSTYFLRSFFFPGAVMCAQHVGATQQWEWHVCDVPAEG